MSIAQDVPVARDRVARNDLLVAAIGVGLAAGAAMLACASLGAAWSGLPPTRPLALTAAVLLGSDAVDGGAGALATGALLWLVVSPLVALPFAVILPRDFPSGSATVLGVAYAWIVLALASSLALPLVAPEMRDGMAETGGAWVLAYTAFGATLGLVPAVRRRIVERRPAPARPREAGAGASSR